HRFKDPEAERKVPRSGWFGSFPRQSKAEANDRPERALFDWAKTMVRDTVSALEWRAKVVQEHNDLPLTDAIILEKAQAFALGTNVPNQGLGWVERFKSQSDLGGARPPRSSGAVDGAESLPLAGLSSQTAFAFSSIPPQATIRESKIDS
ncbi:hypothetical protein LTR48_006263, partial [Friedmanniomyces endolithicus]